MNHVVIINPTASRVRANPSIHLRLSDATQNRATLIEPASVKELHEILDSLSQTTNLTETILYMVGGDGTFNTILNWMMSKPESSRPILVPIGGGQFNFMTKHIGLKSMDPAANLHSIFSKRLSLTKKHWRPISVHDSFTGKTKYGAVMANGVVNDAVRIYNNAGKGNMLNVTRMVGTIIADFVKSQTTGSICCVNPTLGQLVVDNERIHPHEFAGVIVSAVNEFIPLCRPFKDEITTDNMGTIAYWGKLSSLAVSVPLVWIGATSPLTKHSMLNTNAQHVTFKTRDASMLIDGDLLDWPTQDSKPIRTFTFTRGSSIELLYAV